MKTVIICLERGLPGTVTWTPFFVFGGSFFGGKPVPDMLFFDSNNFGGNGEASYSGRKPH